jgi:hypothetical protein
MKALLRWLISMTDMPEPRQSGNSSRACSRTGAGNVAGPAAKLNTRTSNLCGSVKSTHGKCADLNNDHGGRGKNFSV